MTPHEGFETATTLPAWCIYRVDEPGSGAGNLSLAESARPAHGFARFSRKSAHWQEHKDALGGISACGATSAKRLIPAAAILEQNIQVLRVESELLDCV